MRVVFFPLDPACGQAGPGAKMADGLGPRKIYLKKILGRVRVWA